MAEQSVTMEITGLDELCDSLAELAKKYPDKAGELLRADGRELRKKITESAKELTDTSSSSKRSLGKAGSYSVSAPKGLGLNQYVEIKAKSPHFHLVENGHILKTHYGRTIGFVQGRHFLDKAVKQYENEMPETVEKMVDELLKEEGLT